MILNYNKPTIGLFYLVFSLNILIYGLVYFFPQSKFGEPYIPSFIKLFLDVLFLILMIIFGLRKRINSPQFWYLIYLFLIIFLGFLHVYHIGFKEYFHYTFRNVFFYGIFLFINFFPRIDIFKFKIFHEKIFHIVLYIGLILFVFKILGVPNPFSFGAWMWEKNRLISTWLNPNSLGFYMVFYLMYYYHKEEKITSKVLLIIATIFLSGSLTAILGVFFFIAFLIFKLIINDKVKVKYLILFITLFPVLIYTFSYFGVFEYVFFKIDILFIKKSKIHTSVSTRVQNLYDFIDYFRISNLQSILFGDFNTLKYRRLDSQYLNVFYNYGIIALLVFGSFLVSLLKYFYKTRNFFLSKVFFLFNIWLFFFGFNLTAYIYRVNVLVFYFIMLSFCFSSINNRIQTDVEFNK